MWLIPTSRRGSSPKVRIGPCATLETNCNESGSSDSKTGSITMWIPDHTPLTNWNGGKVIPKLVLYSYDGPVIFTASVGLTDFIFYKVGEDSNSDLYLIAPTSDSIISALKTQTLSLRGALSQSTCWLVDVAPDNEVRRFWPVQPKDIPIDVLPDFGLALAPSKTPVADILEQAISLHGLILILAAFVGVCLIFAAIPQLQMLIVVAAVAFMVRLVLCEFC